MPIDLREGEEWLRKAVAQGSKEAIETLGHFMRLEMSTPGMPVVVTGLTTSPHFNGRAGAVHGPATKPGRLLVLLDGDTQPMSFRETNLRKAGGV